MADYIRQDTVKRMLQSANCRLYNLLKQTKKEGSIRYQWSAILRIEDDIKEAKKLYCEEFFKGTGGKI